MATPDFVFGLRRRVGHAPLQVPSTTVAILHLASGRVVIDWGRLIALEVVEILCVRRSNSGAWAPMTSIVGPGGEPTIAAAREILEEADVHIEARRLLSVKVVGPVTYYNGDVATYLNVTSAAQWASGKPSPADGENSETTFFRSDQLPPMEDHSRRTVIKTLSTRSDVGFLTA